MTRKENGKWDRSGVGTEVELGMKGRTYFITPTKRQYHLRACLLGLE